LNFVESEHYHLDDFVARSRQALTQASDRVQETYGFRCSSASEQLQEIEQKASQFEPVSNRQVQVLRFR